MTLCMKNGRVIFFKLNTLMHELIFVKIDFHPASTKNDNSDVAMRKTFVQLKSSKQLHQFRKSKT